MCREGGGRQITCILAKPDTGADMNLISNNVVTKIGATIEKVQPETKITTI